MEEIVDLANDKRCILLILHEWQLQTEFFEIEKGIREQICLRTCNDGWPSL